LLCSKNPRYIKAFERPLQKEISSLLVLPIMLASPLLLNLALLFLLGSAVGFVEFGCHCCPTLLLVLLDLAIGFAGSKCGFLLDSDPCSCWIGFLVCWTLISPLFGQVLLLLWFLVCWSCSFVFLWWRSTQQPLFGFGLDLFGLVFLGPVCCILRLSFVPLVWICFPGLECRVATLLNPFTGSLLWSTFLHCL